VQADVLVCFDPDVAAGFGASYRRARDCRSGSSDGLEAGPVVAHAQVYVIPDGGKRRPRDGIRWFAAEYGLQ
jgi:hypothetical protein